MTWLGLSYLKDHRSPESKELVDALERDKPLESEDAIAILFEALTT